VLFEARLLNGPYLFCKSRTKPKSNRANERAPKTPKSPHPKQTIKDNLAGPTREPDFYEICRIQQGSRRSKSRGRLSPEATATPAHDKSLQSYMIQHKMLKVTEREQPISDDSTSYQRSRYSYPTVTPVSRGDGAS